MNLCTFQNGCMGCCRYRTKSISKIKKAIDIKTEKYKKSRSVQEFRSRAEKIRLQNGVCLNLIKKNDKIICPLHPDKKKGEDLRIEYCKINYFCKTVKEFVKWEKEKSINFLNFFKNSKFDPIVYSLKMFDRNLLREFNKD
ncbi:MAG: hypothetical protein EAX96_20430 [Candidatus Lokiarchaeota archaeon]|nr:hypothetical protein [Candidatus Lokiarchaeota archaeon]